MGMDEDMHVIRGKRGAVQSCNVWDLVVGDIVYLSAGDKVPADCIIADGQSLRVDDALPTFLKQYSANHFLV